MNTLFKYLIFSGILILFSYVVFRIIVRNDYLKKQKLTPVSYLLELIVFAAHANIMYLFIPVKWPNLPSLPETMILKVIAVFLFCFGFIILIVAWFRLGTAPSFGRDRNRLNTSGIYRYSRNPQLVGYGILLTGFMFIFFSWYTLGWFIQYLIISYFMINSEEEFLSRKYGAEYKRYCKSVRRII